MESYDRSTELERVGAEWQANNEEETDIRYFTGFTVIDTALGKLGRITEIDDTTVNVLFIITTSNGEELLIPATDDFVENIDEEGKRNQRRRGEQGRGSGAENHRRLRQAG